MVEFKQFYTQQGVSQLLISLLEHENPVTCLELSAGEGALLDSALLKFPDMNITAFDIDPKNAEFLRSKYPDAHIHCFDSTNQNIIDILKDIQFDIALCNPPFNTINNTMWFKSIIENVFGKTVSTKRIRAEIIFMAINLLCLKQGGELIIVLPDLFYSSASYNWLRESLANRYTLKSIIECDHRSFLKTEAKTYIFHITKSKIKTKTISFFKYENGTGIKKNDIPVSSLVIDDLSHNPSNINIYSVFRGRLSGKECKKSGLPYFHTNSFNEITYRNGIRIAKGNLIARKGDVLIARVGSRVVGKHEIFNGSKAVVSDCIFCISFSDKGFRKFFLNFWTKNKDPWLQDNIKGTCAKHISLISMRMLLDQLLIEYKKPH